MTEYNVQPVSKDKYSVHKWDGGDMPITTYTVLAVNGKLSCSCPSGKYRHYCKHTEFVREYRCLERRLEPIESMMRLSYR